MFQAYIDWLKMNGGTEPRLPNLPYDNKQLFFIGYAQVRNSFDQLALEVVFVLF